MNILGSTYLFTRKLFTRKLVTRKFVIGKYFPGLNYAPKPLQTQLSEQFLAEWRAGFAMDSEQLLAETLSHAARTVPFYREYFAQHPDKDPLRLTDWPVLTRDHLWNEFSALQTTEPVQWKTWTHASGGSTGKPVSVIHDEYFAAKAQALRNLCSEMFFKGPHYNKLILWGMSEEAERKIAQGPVARLKDAARTFLGIKTSHINTFEFTQEKFRECVRILRHQKPQFIFGYAGSIYELAKYLDENGIHVARPPKVIGTTAQTLHQFMRERIEKVFRCDVCDHYGSREVGPVAWQHANGAMYFPRFFSKIEVVDDEGEPVSAGEQGRILITTLHNSTMPLIRYDIGDTGIMGEDVSFNGYPFSTLQSISGRCSEEFTNLRGSRICAPFFINLFYYRSWLDQFYIVQRAYDLIEISYMPKRPHVEIPEAERRELDEKIRRVMTAQCRIVWTKVDQIPTTRSGKRLFIRSEVSADKRLEALTLTRAG